MIKETAHYSTIFEHYCDICKGKINGYSLANCLCAKCAREDICNKCSTYVGVLNKDYGSYTITICLDCYNEPETKALIDKIKQDQKKLEQLSQSIEATIKHDIVALRFSLHPRSKYKLTR